MSTYSDLLAAMLDYNFFLSHFKVSDRVSIGINITALEIPCVCVCVTLMNVMGVV